MQENRLRPGWDWLRQWLFTQVLPSLQERATAAAGPQSWRRSRDWTAPRKRRMQITVAQSQALSLRRIVMQCCGDGVNCMHVQPLQHAQRVRLCLCLPAPAAVHLMDAVMAALPQAEFSLWQAV